MKATNKLISILLVISIIFVFSSCTNKNNVSKVIQGETVCNHEWIDATCTTPKHCNICDEFVGDPIEHDYVDGYCINCNEKDVNYRDFNNYGFYNMYGMNTWIEIIGYNFPKNQVTVEAGKAYYDDPLTFKFWTFRDNYLFIDSIPIEGISNESIANSIGTSKCDPIEKVISNDCVVIWEYGSHSLTISDRVFDSDNTKLVIKTPNSSDEEWYVPADLLDFSTIKKVDSENGGYYAKYSINFKNA